MQRLKDFAKEYVRLSMLGVNNINSLTECTSKWEKPKENHSTDTNLKLKEVLPPLTGTTFSPPDAGQVNQWLMGGFSNYGQAVGQLLNSGQQVTNNSLKSNGINPQDATIHSPPAPNSPFNKPPPNPAPVSVPPPHPPSSFSPPKVSASSINRPNQPSRPTSTSRSGFSNSLPAVSKSLATPIPSGLSSAADPSSAHSQSHQSQLFSSADPSADTNHGGPNISQVENGNRASQTIRTGSELPQPTNDSGRNIGSSQTGTIGSLIKTSLTVDPSMHTGVSGFSSAASPMSPTHAIDSGTPRSSQLNSQSSGADPKTNHPGSQFSNSQLGRTQDGNAEPRATNTVGSPNPAQQASPVSPARQSQGSDSNGSPKQSRQPESVIPTSLQQSTAAQAPKPSQPIRPSQQSQVAQSPKSIVAARPSESAQRGIQQSVEAPPQDVKPTPIATKQSQAAKVPQPSPSSQQSAQAPTVPRQSQAVKQPQSAEPAQGSNQAPATPRQSQAVKQTQPAAPAQVSKQGSNSPRQSQAVQQPQSVSPKQATKQPQSGASAPKPKEQR
jgi:hypothetical protein